MEENPYKSPKISDPQLPEPRTVKNWRSRLFTAYKAIVILIWAFILIGFVLEVVRF